jgi:zinc/manganese transport system substrate-binding protein
MEVTVYRRGRVVVLLLVLALGTVACSAAADSADDETGRVRVFASTDVWASVVQAVGGADVEVTAAVSRPGQDPHDYEATLRDKLAVSKAAVVVYNGGGYDDWAAQLTSSTAGERRVVDAVETSRGEHGSDRAADGSGDQFNEHVFYDFGAVTRVADAVAAALAAVDPDHRAIYEKGAAAVRGELRTLTRKAAAIGTEHPGLTAVATEPVAGYLLKAIGIIDLTPAGYVEQSESDAGPSALVRKETVGVLTSGRARMLVRGAQTEDQVSNQLEGAAKSRNLPEVEVAETLPEGVTTYQAFAERALTAFADAAGSS